MPISCKVLGQADPDELKAELSHSTFCGPYRLESALWPVEAHLNTQLQSKDGPQPLLKASFIHPQSSLENQPFLQDVALEGWLQTRAAQTLGESVALPSHPHPIQSLKSDFLLSLLPCVRSDGWKKGLHGILQGRSLL